MKTMTSKERVLAALNHQEPDKVPVDLGSTANTGMSLIAYDKLKAHLGYQRDTVMLNKSLQLAKMDDDLLGMLGVDTRGIFLGAPDAWEDTIIDDRNYIDEWGVARCKPETSYYYDLVHSPLQDELSAAHLDKYKWPDPNDPGRIRGIKDRVEYLKKNTQCAIVIHVSGGFITQSQYLRGFENWFEDVLLNPEGLGELLDGTLHFSKELTKAVLKEIGHDVDIIHFGDDLGTQNGLMISPDSYRKLIKPRQAELFALAKSLSPAKLLYHTCGSVFDIIDDLIEIGVDALNPVQHNARNMDCRHLKETYGDKITFWGGVDTNTVLPRGRSSDVFSEIKNRISILAPGGGYILNPIHNIQPDVPPENVLTMLHAAAIYGKYPIRHVIR